jgi:hypothetical protein
VGVLTPGLRRFSSLLPPRTAPAGQ